MSCPKRHIIHTPLTDTPLLADTIRVGKSFTTASKWTVNGADTVSGWSNSNAFTATHTIYHSALAFGTYGTVRAHTVGLSRADAPTDPNHVVIIPRELNHTLHRAHNVRHNDNISFNFIAERYPTKSSIGFTKNLSPLKPA